MPPFAIVGAAGNVILFVTSAVAMIIVGGYFVVLAARSYLLIAQNTAAGIDRIRWPDEAAVDWVQQSAWVLGHFLIWIMPAGFLARGLANSFLPDAPALRYFLLMALAMWLLFPLGVLVTLGSAPVSRLFRVLPELVLFYILTFGLLLAALGLLYAGLFTPAWWALPGAAILGTAVILVHARLLGRLGYRLGRVDDPPPREEKAKRKKRRRARAQVTDPWSVPDDLEDEPEPTEGYAVVEQEEAEKKQPRPAYLDPEPEPYTMASGPDVSLPPPTKVEIEKHQIEREVALRTREDEKPPASLFFAGVWEFPLYETTWNAWVVLALFALGTGGLARFMLSVAPF